MAMGVPDRFGAELFQKTWIAATVAAVADGAQGKILSGAVTRVAERVSK
jgi:hypothetical protein